MARGRRFRPPASAQPLIIAAAPLRVPAGSISTQEWVDSGQWVSVLSSDVAAVAYEKDDQMLYVEFWTAKNRPNSVYGYMDVMPYEARNLYHSSSIGRYIHRYIKNTKVFIRIT